MLSLLMAALLLPTAESAVLIRPDQETSVISHPASTSYAFGSHEKPPASNEFKPLDRFHVGTDLRTLWLRTTVAFDAGLKPGSELFIEVDERPDQARLFRPGEFRSPLSSTGAVRPLLARPVNNQRVLLRLPVTPGTEQTFYVAIDSTLPLSGYLRVLTPAGLAQADHDRDIRTAGFFGLMLAMLLLNLLMYRYSRERLYLYYAFVQPWYFIFPAWELGYGYLLWPGIAPWYQFCGILFAQMGVLALAMFTTRIAELKAWNSGLYYAIHILALTAVLSVFIVPPPSGAYSVISGLVFASLLYTGAVSIRRGDRASRFWTAGLTLILLCGIFFIMAEQGLIKSRLNFEQIINVLAITTVVESVAFAISVSERLNQSMQSLIDKQSELIRRLEVERQAAEVSSLAKEQFLMNINHELQTPMTAIIGFSDMILEKIGNPLANAAIIKKSSVRLTQILRDIVDFSSTKRGTVVLSLSEFDVCQVIEEVVELLESEAARRKIGIDNTCEKGKTAVVRADRARTRQILWNIIGNAVRFTDHGEVRVGLETEEDYVRIWVRDSGTGIEPWMREQIFAGFTQADASTKRAQHGIGLGLALSRELANIQGGDVRLNWSEVDKGSEFEVRLPTPGAEQVAITETMMRAAWLEGPQA